MEDDIDGGDSMRPGLHGSARTMQASRRSTRAQPLGGGGLVAAVDGVGGDELRSVVRKRERESREGSEVQGEEGKLEGALGVSVARLEGRGRAAEAGGG